MGNLVHTCRYIPVFYSLPVYQYKNISLISILVQIKYRYIDFIPVYRPALLPVDKKASHHASCEICCNPSEFMSIILYTYTDNFMIMHAADYSQLTLYR